MKAKVSKKTYNEVFKRDHERCVICLTKNRLHYHHILGRRYLSLVDDPNNGVMLCADCHARIVHGNNQYWQRILQKYVEHANSQKQIYSEWDDAWNGAKKIIEGEEDGGKKNDSENNCYE